MDDPDLVPTTSKIDQVKTTEICGKPFIIINMEGLLIDPLLSNSDYPFSVGRTIHHHILPLIPYKQLERCLTHPSGFGFRGLHRTTPVKRTSLGITEYWSFSELMKNLNQYGIDKPTNYPVGGPLSIWLSLNDPFEALSHSYDSQRKTASGFVMVYKADGLFYGEDSKENGISDNIPFGQPRLSFRDRLIGTIRLDWPTWQSTYTPG